MKTMVGTPYYMAPELAKGLAYTSSADTWALGCVLAETLTLRVPFPADNFVSLVKRITEQEHQPIPKVYTKEIR